MTTFVDDDQGYLAWVAAHPDGYVVNCGRTPTPAYLMLHRGSCKFISTSKWSNWTTGDLIKVCSDDPKELGRWASDQVGGALQPCQICSSTRGRSPKGGGKKGRTANGGSGSSPFLTAKNVVEFAAALIAVIGGIVAFLRWVW